jgi:hypothetical protein
MARFFHVDRSRTLRVGMRVDLTPLPAAQSSDQVAPLEFLALWFPGGLSHHGHRYLFLEALTGNANAISELVFELVRRERRPSAPSRYESFFAFRTRDDAERFLTAHPVGGGGTTFEVEGDEAFFADMGWLGINFAGPAVWRAFNYWNQGPSSTDPLWEIFLRPPVKIVRSLRLSA